MKLEEAIRSGKPFRRKCWSGWAYLRGGYPYWEKATEVPIGLVEIGLEELIADDWEVRVNTPDEEEVSVDTPDEEEDKATYQEKHQSFKCPQCNCDLNLEVGISTDIERIGWKS